MKQSIFFIGCITFLTCGLKAQPINEDLPVVTQSIALINAKVVSAPGKGPVVSTIIIRNGLITHVGKDINIPHDAYRIKADSFYAYPAFIDAFSNTGIKETENENQGTAGQGRNQRVPVDSEGNASLEDAGITPFRSVRPSIDAKEKSIADWRSKGFAIAHVIPKGKLIPGKGALLILSGKTTDEVIWKEDISMFTQWAGAGGSYPGTVIGMMAKWRELYHNASNNVAHEKMYSENLSVPRAEYNQAHEALAPVIKKEIPVFFKAQKVKDISRALELQEDLGMNMVIADAEEAWLIKERFANGKTPLVLSLDLPVDKSTSKKPKEDKPTSVPMPDSTKTIEGENPVTKDPATEAFEKRRMESLIAHRAHAAMLAKEGIPFSFGTMSVKSADFFSNIHLLMEQGTTQDQLLAAFTTEPAKLLGISKNCGTIESGKMANVIISNKPIFEKDAAIRYMIVEGDLYEYENKDTRKKNTSDNNHALPSIAGRWSFIIETPDKKREGFFEFVKDGDEFTGKITSDEITTGNEELENIVQEGNTLSFTFDWPIGDRTYVVEFDLEIMDESYKGTVSAEDLGTYTITGDRISSPE